MLMCCNIDFIPLLNLVKECRNAELFMGRQQQCFERCRHRTLIDRIKQTNWQPAKHVQTGNACN